MISPEILKILTPLQKLPKNVGDLGKLIVAKGFKNLPKVNKSPTLVTLPSCSLLNSPGEFCPDHSVTQERIKKTDRKISSPLYLKHIGEIIPCCNNFLYVPSRPNNARVID